MKKFLVVLIALLMLTSCQQGNNTTIESPSINEITTYKEVIKDGKVEIDGISYDIKSVTKTSYTYDDNDNIIKTAKYDAPETRVDHVYEGNQLIEDRRYSNNVLASTTYYYYEDDLLIKKKLVSKGGLEVVTEYFYGDKTEVQTHYNSDGIISFITTAYLDDNDKILKAIKTTADGEMMTSSSFHYENDLLVKVISERGKAFYEYNNVGDKIMDYSIFYGNVITLIANFYDYEYDENLLPITVTIHRVQSLIADEDIRKYQ